MKKLLSLLMIFVLGFIMIFSLAEKSYAAEGDVTVQILVFFDEGEPTEIEIDVPKGQVIDISNLGEVSEEDFAFWIVNGVVRHDLDSNARVLATQNLVLYAIFDTDQHPVIFMDSNGHLLELYFVEDGESSLIPDLDWEEFTKPGLQLITEEESPVWLSLAGNLTLEEITEPSVFSLQYELAEGVLPVLLNGEEVPYNSVHTFVSYDPEFSYWADGDGQVISYQNPLLVTALVDRDVVEVAEGEASVDAHVFFMDVTGIREGKNSFLGQFYLSDEAELVEFGFMIGDTPFQSNVFHPTTKEFLRSMDPVETEVKAYLSYKLNDELFTIFSDGAVDLPLIDETWTAITTPAEFRALVASQNQEGKWYLANDLDFEGFSWVNHNGIFKGIFDGNGKTIKNVTIERTGIRASLFYDTVAGAIIRNLVLENISVTTDRGAAILLGNTQGDTLIKNIKVVDSYVKGGDNVGTGIILGRTNNGTGHTVTIKNIYVENTMAESTAKNVGIVGRQYATDSLVFENILIIDSTFKSDSNANDNGLGTVLGTTGGSPGTVSMTNIVVIDPTMVVAGTSRSIGAALGNMIGSTVTITNAFVKVDLTGITHTRSGVVGHGNEANLALVVQNNVYGQILNQKIVTSGNNSSLGVQNVIDPQTIDSTWWETNLPDLYNSPFFRSTIDSIFS